MNDLSETEIVEDLSGQVEEIEEQVDTGPTEEQIAAQEEAKKYGWKPKEEFDLAPDGWVDADRFLELPSTNNKRLRDESKALNAKIEESTAAFNERVERIEAMNKAAMERALEAQKAQFEARQSDIAGRQRAAAEVGDVEQYDALETERAKLKAPEPIAPAALTERQQNNPDVDAYREKNEWTKDPVLWKFAFDSVEARPEVKMLPAKEQIAYAERVVKDLFPHKFAEPEPEPRRAKRQMVEGGGFGAPSTPSKGINALPPEALKQGKEFVAEGLFKSLDDYAKSYHEQG